MPILLQQPTIPNPLSWNLTVDSTVLVVTGSMSIGTVMVQLVNRLGREKKARDAEFSIDSFRFAQM